MKGDKHIIQLISEDMGIKTSNDEAMFNDSYHVSGERSTLFRLLCDAIDTDPNLKNLMELALKFNKEHDKANCLHCNPDKKN